MEVSVIVNHLLRLRAIDVEYARHAYTWYCRELPWLDIKGAMKEALK